MPSIGGLGLLELGLFLFIILFNSDYSVLAHLGFGLARAWLGCDNSDYMKDYIKVCKVWQCIICMLFYFIEYRLCNSMLGYVYKGMLKYVQEL